uniref:Alternative protein SLC25A25 n=1 Tax=Homo sapiens TaxID=9606 RepID=L0R8F1_HUMAN|nr:alternative protein SLC25A25 [Homo sapiens]
MMKGEVTWPPRPDFPTYSIDANLAVKEEERIWPCGHWHLSPADGWGSRACLGVQGARAAWPGCTEGKCWGSWCSELAWTLSGWAPPQNQTHCPHCGMRAVEHHV